METPNVSIIIPLFQANPDFLIESITSVFQQTLKSWELILVDDACPNSTGDALTQTLKDYPNTNIRIFRLDQNSGVAAARNVGASRAKAPYLQFLDQDDRLDPACSERCLSILTQFPEIDIIRVTPQNPLNIHPIQHAALTNSLMTTALIPAKALKSVGGWPIDPIFSNNPYAGEDICLKTLLETRYTLKTVQDPLYFHRFGHGNHTDRFLSRSKVVNDELIIFEGMEWDLKLADWIQKKTLHLKFPLSDYQLPPVEVHTLR